MAKDYVSRTTPKSKAGGKKSAAKRSTGGQKGRNNSASKRAPHAFKSMLAALVLALMCYGLYLLLNTTPDQRVLIDELKEQEKPAVNDAIEQPAGTQLPVLEDEEWSFIEDLPNYEVEVDAEALVDDQRYILQCGSFRRIEQAEQMRATIAFAGLEAQVRLSEGRNGSWYRVVLGPFDGKREAERNRHLLSDVNLHQCALWQYSDNMGF